jgi:hypothetical protein
MRTQIMGGDFTVYGKWQQTPWWHPMRWFGYRWRQWNWNTGMGCGEYDGDWIYQTTQIRALDALREWCDGA